MWEPCCKNHIHLKVYKIVRYADIRLRDITTAQHWQRQKMISCCNRYSDSINIEQSSFQFEGSQLYDAWKTARSLVNGLTVIHDPERRDEKSRPARFTRDTTVNRFRSHIFSFTRRSRVRNSAFGRFIFSVYTKRSPEGDMSFIYESSC